MSTSWERFKELMRSCPHHGIPDWMLINCFYNGLSAQAKLIIDATSGGALWAKSYTEAYDLIELMAANEYQHPTSRMPQQKVAGLSAVDQSTSIAAELEALSLKVDALAKRRGQAVMMVCELCAGAHATEQCVISAESVNFVSNSTRPQAAVPQYYHPNNRNHPNFSWSNQGQAQVYQPQ